MSNNIDLTFVDYSDIPSKDVVIISCVDGIGPHTHDALLYALARTDIKHVVVSIDSSGGSWPPICIKPVQVKALPIAAPRLTMLDPENRATRRRAKRNK